MGHIEIAYWSSHAWLSTLAQFLLTYRVIRYVQAEGRDKHREGLPQHLPRGCLSCFRRSDWLKPPIAIGWMADDTAATEVQWLDRRDLRSSSLQQTMTCRSLGVDLKSHTDLKGLSFPLSSAHSLVSPSLLFPTSCIPALRPPSRCPWTHKQLTRSLDPVWQARAVLLARPFAPRRSVEDALWTWAFLYSLYSLPLRQLL